MTTHQVLLICLAIVGAQALTDEGNFVAACLVLVAFFLI